MAEACGRVFEATHTGPPAMPTPMLRKKPTAFETTSGRSREARNTVPPTDPEPTYVLDAAGGSGGSNLY